MNTKHFEFSNEKGNKENGLLQQESNNKEEVNTNLGEGETNMNSNLESTSKIENNREVNSSVVEENKVEVNNNTQTVSKNEQEVISYFESSSNLLSENSNQEDRSLREKAKDSFTTVIDFIFYDKEIKGYTFKELTNTAKLKVIKLALTIDHKIDSYFPNYKETIKDKYTDFKGKLAVKYLEFTSSLCDSVGADTCNQAKEDFNTMKESFGFTWQLIKELAKSGSNKVKDFYESWRDSN